MTNMPWAAILSRFDKLGIAMSDTAKKGIEFLWPLAYRQAVVSGVSSTFWGLLMILLGVIGPWKCINRLRSDDCDWEEEPIWIVGMVVCAIVGIIGIFLFASGVETLANPGWVAIDNLAGLLQSQAQ